MHEFPHRPRHKAVRPGRRQRHSLYAVAAVLMVSGLVWLVAHYALPLPDDAARHPAEPWAMRIHGAATLLGMAVLGALWSHHVLPAWRAGEKRATGLPLLGIWLALAVSGTLILAACGGGGSSSPAGFGPTVQATAFSQGPISGFGSVIVNGVRFDDSGAEVENEDGGGSRSDLKLGTMVEIESEAIDDSTGRAKAVKIRFGSETVGPVESVAADGASMIVIGQTVDIKPETVFDDSLPTTLAELAGKVVEVHGQIDAATGHIVATRVEDKADAAFFKVRGVVAGLDTTAKTFTIGTATISYAGIADADLPAQFADGLKVRVRLQTGFKPFPVAR